MIKWVVFDVMGVVFTVGDDTNDLLVPFIWERNAAISREAINEIYVRTSLGQITSRQFWEEVGLGPDYPEVEQTYLDTRLTIDADFLPTARRLSERGFSLGLLSNDVSEWSAYMRARHSMDFLAAVTISGDVRIFVDDRCKNLAAARARGFVTVRFARQPEESSFVPDATVTGFAQLEDAIADLDPIGRLLAVLRQRRSNAAARRSAREGLVKAGKAAHQQLIGELEIMWPTNREGQTAYKKEILSVLGETGDRVCVPILKAFLTYDPPAAEAARAAIAAIQARCGGKDAAKLEVPRSLATKKVGKTGDAYVDECFRIDFDEMYDGRVWHEVPEAKAIPEAADAGRLDEALRLAEELRRDQPDYCFGYCWLAELHRRQNRDEDARKALIDGLEHARSKQSLCTAMGELEWKGRNLSEAAKWWIKSVAVQVGSQYATDYVAFLHLSYVAEALGLRTACSELRSWVDRLPCGRIRLTTDAENELYLATIEQGAPPLQRAIERLEQHYLRSPEE
jgi:FMN phosphatase YigB (HAD superfamily)